MNESPDKTERYQKRLISIAFYIFIVNGASMLTGFICMFTWEVIAILWVVLSAIVVLLLAIAIFMRSISDYKKDNTDYQYNAIYRTLHKKVITNIGLWVNTCFYECLKIICRIKKTHCVKCTNNTTNNHALHTKNLAQDIGCVNHNGKEPCKLGKGILLPRLI